MKSPPWGPKRAVNQNQPFCSVYYFMKLPDPIPDCEILWDRTKARFLRGNAHHKPCVKRGAWDAKREVTVPSQPKTDGIATALRYAALLEHDDIETRADLARHLGVSRARVTQVLNRLPC